MELHVILKYMNDELDELDELELDDNYLSECCEAPIQGLVTTGFGICSICKEWSETKHIPT